MEQNETGFMGFVESAGGADMFIWMAMFAVLLIGAAILVYTNRE